MKNLNTENVARAIIELLQSYLAGNVHTSMPGRVESYDRTKRTGSVKPMLKICDSSGTQIELPVIPDVPFAIYGTASASVVLPVSAGDYVLMIFSERAIGRFMQNGQQSVTSFEHTFSLGDAIALPGIFPGGSSIPSTGANDITIINNGGKVVLNASGDIELGTGTLSKLVTDAFSTLYNAHTHNCATPGSPSGPPLALMTALQLTSKVKAQ